MPFQMLVPQSRKSAGILISSTPGRGSRSGWQLNVSIPTPIYAIAFKDAQKVNIALGEGADKGKLLITPNEAGHFEPKRLMHTVIFRLPANADITPDFEMKEDDVDRRDWEGGGLVLTLPVWADKERYEHIKKARAEAARPIDQKRVVPLGLR
jgi:hypothetical protein